MANSVVLMSYSLCTHIVSNLEIDIFFPLSWLPHISTTTNWVINFNNSRMKYTFLCLQINAIVYTFSPALAVSKNPTNATVVAAESTNENLNSTQLNNQRILQEFQVKCKYKTTSSTVPSWPLIHNTMYSSN